jgi:hypothetical protein
MTCRAGFSCGVRKLDGAGSRNAGNFGLVSCDPATRRDNEKPRTGERGSSGPVWGGPVIGRESRHSINRHLPCRFHWPFPEAPAEASAPVIALTYRLRLWTVPKGSYGHAAERLPSRASQVVTAACFPVVWPKPIFGTERSP